MEKTCLDNVLHLHAVIPKIHFRLYVGSRNCSGCHQLVTSGLCSGEYFLAWNICVCAVKV
jgi:hypothetical protein